MRHIVVIAYQLHYSKGSEYSVAWNYVKNMSQNNKLTVIYGTSNGHHNIGNTEEMERWTASNPVENVVFVALKPSFHSHNYDFSLYGQKKFYDEYKKWHKDVRRYVEELMKQQTINLIHYVGPIGWREPGYLHALPVPYIRGPIGGLGGANFKLLKATGSFKLAMHFFMKRMLNEMQCRLSRRNIKALKNSDVVICATSEQQEIVTKLIGKHHHSKLLFRQENCLERIYELNEKKFYSEIVSIIFIGSIDGRKGLPLILEALKKLPKDTKIELNVVGDGSAKKQLEKKSEKIGVNHFIKWHGNVPREQVFEMLGEAHLMVLPSLMEGNPTTIWEAMAQGVPSLTLHNCGMRDTVTDETGFSVPITSYSEVVNRIASILSEISKDIEVLHKKAYKVLEDRNRYLWDERKTFFEQVYSLAEENFKKRKVKK